MNDSEATSPPPPQEENDSDNAEQNGVVVPEEFQQQAHQLIHKANKPMLSHIRDRVYAREDELRQDEAKKSSKGKGKSKGPEVMSDADMPA